MPTAVRTNSILGIIQTKNGISAFYKLIIMYLACQFFLCVAGYVKAKRKRRERKYPVPVSIGQFHIFAVPMASVLLRPDIILVHPFNIIVKCVQPGSLMFIHIAFIRTITVVFDILQRFRQE